MATDENGGEFGGDGSVRWEIRSGDEIKASSDSADTFKVARRRGKSGTRCTGIDCQHGNDFVVTVKLPEKMSADEFIKGIKKAGRTISFRVPIKPVSKQIRVRWGQDV
jgi:hypothetical protein